MQEIPGGFDLPLSPRSNSNKMENKTKIIIGSIIVILVLSVYILDANLITPIIKGRDIEIYQQGQKDILKTINGFGENCPVFSPVPLRLNSTLEVNVTLVNCLE